MGKGIASGYIPQEIEEITICQRCFHRDVCGDKDYLTENLCHNLVNCAEISTLREKQARDSRHEPDARPLVYAIDFDGTLCQNAYPAIGVPKMAVIEHFKQLRKDGHKMILWTCREGKELRDAIRWCAAHGLYFDAHNANLPELIELYGTDPRKVGADFYVDDKNYWGEL